MKTIAHPAEKAFDKEKIDRRNAEAMGKGPTLKPLKEIRSDEPIVEQFVEPDSGPRYSAMESARSAMLPSPSFGTTENNEAITALADRMITRENIQLFTRLSDDEVKAIALLTSPMKAFGKRAKPSFIDRAIADFMNLRVSREAEGRTAFERIMEALGYRREINENKNPIQALFEKMGRK